MNTHLPHTARTDSGTICAALIATFAIGTAAAATPDPQELASEPYFRKVQVSDLQPEMVSAIVVTEVDPGQAAARGGLREGDRILALNGYRVYTDVEYMFVRDVLSVGVDTQLDVVVSRRGRILPFRFVNLTPLRRAAFTMKNTVGDFYSQLRELGIEVPAEMTTIWMQMNPRTALALHQWRSGQRDVDEQLDWLRDFVGLRTKLANQQWQDIRVPSHQSPIPYFQRLTAFYLSVAKRNAAGDHLPDPAAHGVSDDYFVFHYPAPRISGPALGEVKTSDSRFNRRLKVFHANRASGYLKDLEEPEDEGPLDEEESEDAEQLQRRLRSDPILKYVEKIKLSILIPESHGGWPFRYGVSPYSVTSQSNRQQMIKLLEAKLDNKDQDWPLYAYSLVALYQKERKIDQLLDMIQMLRQQSPYLAFRAWQLAGTATSFQNRSIWRDLQPLIQYATEQPFAFAPANSDLVNYLIARNRYYQVPGNHCFEGRPRSSYHVFHPVPFAVALGSRPTKDVADELDAAIDQLGSGAADAAEWFGQMEQLARLVVNADDFERFDRMSKAGERKGEILESLNRCLYSSVLTQQTDYLVVVGVGDQIIRDVFWEHPRQSSEGYTRLYQEIASLDWSDAQAARGKLVQLFNAHGSVASAFLVAQALAAHGFAQDARHYREQGTKIIRYLATRMSRWSTFYSHYLIDLCAMSSAEGGDHELAEFLAQHYQQLTDNPTAPGLLHLARCKLAFDELDDAATALAQSFSSPNPDNVQPLYLFEGQTTYSASKYQLWLLKQIASHPDFDDKVKRILADSDARRRFPQHCQQLLGIPIAR